jgi:hypothetical protein
MLPGIHSHLHSVRLGGGTQGRENISLDLIFSFVFVFHNVSKTEKMGITKCRMHLGPTGLEVFLNNFFTTNNL